MPSRVKELADEEAARAEAENPDDEDEAAALDDDAQPSDPDDAEPADEDAHPDAEPPSAEARAAMLETAIGLYNDSMRTIMGDEWDGYDTCFLCGGMGAVPPDHPLHDQATMRCPDCQGFGSFVTDSHVPDYVTRQCPRCIGNGYVEKPIPVPQPLPPVAPFAVTSGTDTYQPPAQPSTPGQAIPPMPVYDPIRNAWIDPANGAILSQAG